MLPCGSERRLNAQYWFEESAIELDLVNDSVPFHVLLAFCKCHGRNVQSVCASALLTASPFKISTGETPVVPVKGRRFYGYGR